MLPEGSRVRRGLIAVLACALAVAACGGNQSSQERPPGVVFGATAAGAALTATPSLDSPTPSPTAAEATIAAGTVSEVTVVATDNVFTPAGFRTRAGEPFRLTVQNRGQAVHDWRVLNVKDAGGRDLGTSLLPSGQSQTVTLTIEQPGEYAVYCEVHPVEMRGRLTVE